MKRSCAFVLIFALVLSLAACGGDSPAQTTAPETTVPETTVPETTVPETTVPETTVPETTAPATEPVVLYRNPLNGQPLEEPWTRRPIAVTINNIKHAMPQCGVESASIVYEILAEGGITRCLAVYDDISGLEHIGAIRSARTYFIDLVMGLDALYVHHGYSTYAGDMLRSHKIQNLCPVMGRGSGAYYRDQARLDAGYSLEHTSFADGDDLLAQMDKRGYTMTREEGVDFGWCFAEDATPENGEPAGQIVVTFRKKGKTTTLTYDGGSGQYRAAQYGADYIDGNSGQTMAFKNVLVLYARSWSDDEGYRQFVELTDTSGSGYFACNGTLVPIRWSRGGYGEPFVYTLEDGTPLTLNVGSSYIAIVPTGSTVTYQ